MIEQLCVADVQGKSKEVVIETSKAVCGKERPIPSVCGDTEACSAPGWSCINERLLKTEVVIPVESKVETEKPWLKAVLAGFVNVPICRKREVPGAIGPEARII